MNGKLCSMAVLLLVLASLSGILNPLLATVSTEVGVEVGDIADYVFIEGNLAWHFQHTQVTSVSGAIVSLNVTRFYKNGTVDPSGSGVLTGNVSRGDLYWNLITVGLSVGDRCAPSNSGVSSINKTFTASIAGRSRVVNEASLDPFSLWWDQATGLMVRIFDSWGDFDVTLVSTTAFGLDYSAMFLVLGCTFAVIVASIAVVLVIVKRGQASRRMTSDNKHQYSRSS
ncbi:MAG: hypothetical protein WED05_05310 [Candidatus Atabeyarchaeum deiterrae]